MCCVFLQGNWAALHFAALNGSNNVISLLLSNGADVNIATTTVVSYRGVRANVKVVRLKSIATMGIKLH